MSPISSIPTAFALPTAAPSIPVDPGSAGQSASMMSQHLVETGGILFAVVAIVSVAGYFHHGRKKPSNAQRNSTWATFSKILSSMRHRGSGTAAATAGSDWPADVEGGPEHVSTVYTRFFHPTYWNLVESHPATSSAPAIFVENEAKEIPASEPESFGMNSFLDRHGGEGDGRTDARENAVQGTERRVAKVPPYDTGSATNVGFKSEIIGTTDRPGGAFLSVPGQYRDGSSETSSSDDAFQTLPGSEIDFSSSPYDGIVTEPEIDLTYSPDDRILTTPPRTPDDAFETLPDSQMDLVYSPYDGSLTDPELPYHRDLTSSQELVCSSCDGVTTTSPPSPGQSYETTPDSDTDPRYSPYGGIVIDSQPDISREPIQMTSSRSFPSTRRYGMADMADFARTLKDIIPEGGRGLVRTITCRSGLCDLTDLGETRSEMQSTTSYKHLDRLKPGDDNQRSLNSVHDGHDDFRKHWADPDTFGPLYESLDLLQRIIDEQDDKGSVLTIGRGRGLGDLVDFVETDSEMDSATPYSHLDRLKPMDDKPKSSSSDISVHDSGDDFRKNWADPDTFRPLYEGLDLLQKIIDDLDDSDADSIPQSLSEDGDFVDSEDDDVDEGNVSLLTPAWDVESPGQVSLEWSSLIYPVTPPQRSAMTLLKPPCVHQACVGPPVTPRFDEEVQVFPQTCSGPPPWLPCKAYVRTLRPRRPLLMVCESPPEMSTMVQVVAPGVYKALMESPVTPCFTEEVQATYSGSPPGLQSKAYVRTHRRSRPLPMVRNSLPQMPATLQVVAPSGHKALMEPPVCPWFAEEVQATCSGSPPGLQSKAYVRPHRLSRPLPMVHNSLPQMPAMLQVVAPSGYKALMESLASPSFAEEVQATYSGSPPGLQSKAYVRPRHPQLMVCGPYLLPYLASEAA